MRWSFRFKIVGADASTQAAHSYGMAVGAFSVKRRMSSKAWTTSFGQLLSRKHIAACVCRKSVIFKPFLLDGTLRGKVSQSDVVIRFSVNLGW